MIRLSDPKPAFCSACHNTPDCRYVDFDAAHDGGCFVDRETQAYMEGSDDLHICENCLRVAMEKLAFKPELHSKQFNEIRKQDIQIEALKAQVRSLKAALAAEPEPEARRPGPRRKVAA
jgi:hypothetical protein